MDHPRRKHEHHDTAFLIFLILFLACLGLIVLNARSLFAQVFVGERTHSVDPALNLSYHWDHMPLRYSFSDGCTNMIKERMVWAFSILQNDTSGAVRFVEGSAPDLVITCHSELPTEQGLFRQGEGTFNSQGTKIVSGQIEFYNIGDGRYHAGCIQYPDVELHELLHTFSFGHSELKTSIMYHTTQDCAVQSVDETIIDMLVHDYPSRQ